MTDIFLNKRVIGTLGGGTFTQVCYMRHIFRQYNAKGIDQGVYTSLKVGGQCRRWRLVFRDTGQVLTIPFEKIEAVGFVKNTGAGRQMLVKLKDFNEERPVLQQSLL